MDKQVEIYGIRSIIEAIESSKEVSRVYLLKSNSHQSSLFRSLVRLLEHNNIAVVPGDAYGKTTSHFIRLSFGTESIDRIEKALQIISNKTSQ